MRVTRFALPAALAAVTLALATFASPALADDSGTTTLGSFPGEVTFGSPVLGTVMLDYTCKQSDPTEVLTLRVEVIQSQINDYPGASAAGSKTADCDGALKSAPIALTLSSGAGFVAGWASLHVSLGAVARSSDVMVIRTGVVEPPPPGPVKGQIFLSTNASPESVVKGKKISVKGTLSRYGAAFKARTQLEFAPDSSGTYAKVKSVTSAKSGKLSTTVEASESGSFRYVYVGSSTNEAATSRGDHIVVTPKPKAYKTCTALHLVYPHGVGKSGAKDKGGDVTTFTRDNKTYAKNKKSDRDKDGIACEQN